MPKLDTYLFFNGNCAEAMKFYEKTLGGKLDMMKEKDAPKTEKGPQGNSDKILHARLAFDGGVLMASDWMDSQKYPGMGGFSISLVYTKIDEAKRAFDALSKGGKVAMPMGKTFWVESFGMAIDRFGTSWMISGGKPLLTQ
jgi:PhnB protein